MRFLPNFCFDSFLLSAVCAEARAKAVGGYIRQVRQVGEYDILIRVAGASGIRWLLISAHPKYAHLNVTHRAPEHADKLHTAFLSAIQRRIEGAKVKAVEQLDFDRLVRIALTGRNEIGDAVELHLMIELMGKHSNIVLTDSDGRIIDALKRLPSSVNRYREVLPGRVYIRPPSHGRINPLSATREQVELALRSADGGTLQQWLQTAFHGMSSVLSSELLFRVGLSGDEPVSSIGEEQVEALLNALSWLRQIILLEQFKPVCIRSADGKLMGCYPVELEHLRALGTDEAVMQEPCDGLCECISEWLGQARSSDEVEQLRKGIRRELERALRGVSERISLLREQLAEAQHADEWRVKGELLLSHAHEVEDGITEVTLDDYFGGKVKIQLDPKLSPVENAQRYFSRYKRMKGACEHLSKAIAKLEAVIGELGNLIAQLDGTHSLEELKRISERAAQLKLLRAHEAVAHTDEGSGGKFLRFTVADGFELLVGRNAQENMELITRVANPDDLWMHVRGARGAHGILRKHNRAHEFTQVAIEEAARIIAMRSKRKGKVAVDCALAKYVRPVKGEHGKVSYTNHKTVIVSIEAQ